MKKWIAQITALMLILIVTPAFAHFGTLIPSDDIIAQGESKTVTLQLKFVHPMEMHYMHLVKLNKFGVMSAEKHSDLLGTLKATKGKSADQKEEFSAWTFVSSQ